WRGPAPPTVAGSIARSLRSPPTARLRPAGGGGRPAGRAPPRSCAGGGPGVPGRPRRARRAPGETPRPPPGPFRPTNPPRAGALEPGIVRAALGDANGRPGSGGTAAELPPPGLARTRAYFAEAAGTAARYLARPDGPRVGAMGFVGWDTHINEGAADGQLAGLLSALDGALAAIERNLAAAWAETAVVVITEFGRTARINGSNGTD